MTRIGDVGGVGVAGAGAGRSRVRRRRRQGQGRDTDSRARSGRDGGQDSIERRQPQAATVATAHPQRGATSAAGGSTPHCAADIGRTAGRARRIRAAEATAALDAIVAEAGRPRRHVEVATDTTTDNAAAKTADPKGAAASSAAGGCWDG